MIFARKALPLALLFAAEASEAFRLNLQFPFFNFDWNPLVPHVPQHQTPRIAIIGAGAGGSSAAFWISKAQERFGLDVDVDVYERTNYIGGRARVVYPYNDTTLPGIEVGASIFVEANKNLWRASTEFNLTRVDLPDGGFGIWDGDGFLLNVPRDVHGAGGLWNAVKFTWRYGLISRNRLSRIVAALEAKFGELYTLDSPKWDNITNLASSLGWTEIAGQTTLEFFESKGVSKKYLQEVVEGITRVNYLQDVNHIHALAGAVSVAAAGAVSITGGVWQVFDEFIRRSQANLLLNTSVHTITHNQTTSSNLWTVVSDAGSREYKGVIIATPFHASSIELPPALASRIPPQPYVRIHVTLLTTAAHSPNQVYFGLPANVDAPQVILTSSNARKGGKQPEFHSLTYHGFLEREGEEPERVVKIFSKERISDELLENLFPGPLGWVHRQEWDAYPELPPTTTFPPVRLDRGLYYVNAFEPFISCMETETIASRNVVDLLLNEEFGSGICGNRIGATELMTQEEEKDFVLGWDC